MKICTFLTLFLFAACPGLASAVEPVDYARDIKPLFAKNCVSCHGPTKQSSSLRLDAFSLILKGGDSGPILTAGKSAASKVIIAVTGGKSDVVKMPPKGTLSADEIALLKRWIDEGAKGPEKEEVVAAAKSSHWSFQPIRRWPEPAVTDTKWAKNAIDRFILAELEKKKIRPSPEADPVTLIRRVSLDLTGLPPTIAEVDRFLKEHTTSPEAAYESLVDRLLQSPHYGEMQGRHWLDLARSAYSNGYSIDAPRQIWKYRDWVIDAFNRDLPFDRFTIEQLAGDLLPKATTEQKVATGFHRNTQINQEGGIDLEQFRVDSIIDRVNTTGSVWLGLTVGCAQCHDHKFDPFSQREYYQLFAFFNNCDEPNLEIAAPDVQKERVRIQARIAAIEKELTLYDTYNEDAIEKWERGITDETRNMVPKPIAAIFLVAIAGRNAKQKKTLEDAYRFADQVRHPIGAMLNPISAIAHTTILNTRFDLVKQRDELRKQAPPVTSSMVLQETKKPRVTTILLGGDFLRKGVPVTPGTPTVLPRPEAKPGLNRLNLAKWLVADDNPMTARVAMNRYWGQFFGTGIVETENDLGTQGSPPSHPELLDWLASEFHRQKWSVKAMHKLIVMSATYRQASDARPDLATVDARNRLLARQARIRVPAEIVRDTSLVASGLLNPKVGGPGIYPPQPDGIYRFTQIDKQWKPSAGPDRFRRGMYTYFWRSAPHPALIVFDAPDSNATCTRRVRSNTPLQALTLLNDTGFYEYAVAMGRRIVKDGPADDEGRAAFAFRLCLARSPSSREQQRLSAFVAAQKSAFTAKPSEAKQLTDETGTAAIDLAVWIMTARVLLNLDEFITRE